MEIDRKEFIKQLLQQGKSREETKVQLVSNGYSSQGFEDEYRALVSELNINEPVAPSAFSYDMKAVQNFAQKDAPLKGTQKKLGSLIVFLTVASLILWGISAVIPIALTQFSIDQEQIKWGEEAKEEAPKKGESFNFTDTLAESKAVSTAVSADVYVKRMGFFDGVCKDISVVAPVICLQTTTSYVLFVPLASGYYCKDSVGFAGKVEKRPTSGDSCEE